MLGVIIRRMPICAIKKDCWHRLLELIIGNKLFENYYLNNNYKLRTNMKNRKTLLAVLAGLALSSCTTRVTTENDASLKGVLGDKFLVGVH